MTTKLQRLRNKSPRTPPTGSRRTPRQPWRRPRRSYGVPMSSGATPRLDEIDLSEHAVAQYRERVRPALELAGARAELPQLVLSGQILAQPPHGTRAASPKPFYLVI